MDDRQTRRIGGWGRVAIVVGIVLSIAWIGIMLVRGSQQMSAQRIAIADDAKKSCEERSNKIAEDCSGVWLHAYLEAQKRDDDLPTFLKPGVLEALFPVFVGWLIAYGIIAAIRWVADGFRKNSIEG